MYTGLWLYKASQLLLSWAIYFEKFLRAIIRWFVLLSHKLLLQTTASLHDVSLLTNGVGGVILWRGTQALTSLWAIVKTGSEVWSHIQIHVYFCVKITLMTMSASTVPTFDGRQKNMLSSESARCLVLLHSLSSAINISNRSASCLISTKHDKAFTISSKAYEGMCTLMLLTFFFLLRSLCNFPLRLNSWFDELCQSGKPNCETGVVDWAVRYHELRNWT